jgi:hypothetical protein
MSDSRRFLPVAWSTFGLLCVLAMFMLSSLGVRVVRADEQEASTSADPALVEGPPPAAPVVGPAPRPPSREPSALDRAGVPSIEVSPGIVVLNTRGYNYGPLPAEPDPEASPLESKTD